jgi:hypothetical protein
MRESTRPAMRLDDPVQSAAGHAEAGDYPMLGTEALNLCLTLRLVKMVDFLEQPWAGPRANGSGLLR